MPVHNRPQKLKSVFFEKLKNLENLNISFEDKPITGLFGSNGSGKSTVLHALACTYKPVDNSTRDNIKFSKFFVPTNLAVWNDSQFLIKYNFRNGNEEVEAERTYSKSRDRWKPRYAARPAREVFFIGIETCVPTMEKEKRKSVIHLLLSNIADTQLANKIKDSISYIMQRNYSQFVNYSDTTRTYKGLCYNGINYASLYMGAGEQRILYILEMIYTVPDYSLILIDELDLTIHTQALIKLIERLNNECVARHLQIIFTSHREELLNCRSINIRHLINNNGKTSVCLDHTTPECLKRLTGDVPRNYDIFVEDKLAEALVRQVLKQHNAESYCNIWKFGSKENSYQIGAGLICKGETLDNSLIVLDGDVDRTDVEKKQKIRKVIIGSDIESARRRDLLLSKIKQFTLPEATKPEVYIKTQLATLEEDNSLLTLIKEYRIVNDHHEYLTTPINESGMIEEVAYCQIADMLSRTDQWGIYVEEINNWILNTIVPNIN